jgi:hypothetical protein
VDRSRSLLCLFRNERFLPHTYRARNGTDSGWKKTIPTSLDIAMFVEDAGVVGSHLNFSFH